MNLNLRRTYDVLRRWRHQYGRLFLALLLMQVVAYSYFYTHLIFTNHTFPNTWLYSYPGFKTTGEGRWLADLIIWAQGGSGVQSFQMVAATALHALNGIILARILRLESKAHTFGVAAVVCLYPAFLDYYSFSIDHLTFVLGDTLILAGALSFLSSGHRARRIFLSAFCFLLGIAAYQPKVSLVGLMACVCLIMCFTRKPRSSPDQSVFLQGLRDLAEITMAVVLAVGLYWLSVRLTVVRDIGERTYVNTLSEGALQVLASYPKFFHAFTREAVGLPPWLRFLPAATIGLGTMAVSHAQSVKGESSMISVG